MPSNPRSGARSGALLAALAATLLLPACVAPPHHHAPPDAVVRPHGPPPHARAHGWRYGQGHNVEMVFDDALGVYVVVGFEHHYYDGSRYLRWYRGGWQASAALDGAWVWIRTSDVPHALHARVRKQNGPVPAKADW